jgi:phosphoadenosine phosphosulfate reductase
MNESKIKKTIEVLELARDMSFEFYNKPLVITYSGGKDSDVLLDLARKHLRPTDFEVINSHTSVDAPETVYHIREVFKDVRERGTKCTVHIPKDKDGNQITMWNLIPKKKMPPTRLARYCCAVLKETSTPNRICAVGVRASESSGRQGRDIFATKGKTKKDAYYYSLEHSKEVFEESKDRDPIWDCRLIEQMRANKDIIVNPIYEWTDSDIWEYIRENNIKYNPLYDRGYKRVGCIGCPIASYKEMMKEFSEYPKIKDAYIRAFQRMIDLYDDEKKAKRCDWKTGQDVFDWWTEKWKNEVKGQIDLENWLKESETK